MNLQERYNEDPRDFEDDQHYSGYCGNCGKFVSQTVTEDHGIGPYEYWGARGVHHDNREVCPHCGWEAVVQCSLPCHANCRHYDTEDHENDCDLDLSAINIKGPATGLDLGDECRFFDPKDDV